MNLTRTNCRNKKIKLSEMISFGQHLNLTNSSYFRRVDRRYNCTSVTTTMIVIIIKMIIMMMMMIKIIMGGHLRLILMHLLQVYMHKVQPLISTGLRDSYNWKKKMSA